MRVAASLLLVFFVFGCTALRPSTLGVKDGKLFPCPKSPNCVSSQSEDEIHYVKPFAYGGTKEEAIAKLIAIIESMKRTNIITKTDNYIHAEFTSLIFRFTDDVEFYFDDKGNTIHVRSASRVGHSDMGVNRKRVEKIREKFDAVIKK